MKKGVIDILKDSGKMQTAQISGLHGENHNEVEYYQPYGFSSNNLTPDTDGKGSECLIEHINGMPVCIVADDRRFRPKGGSAGDVTIYTNNAGQRITLTPSGSVKVKNGSVVIELTASGNILMTGNVQITGDVTINGSVTANGKIIDDTHKHTGVQPGAGLTGVVS